MYRPVVLQSLLCMYLCLFSLLPARADPLSFPLASWKGDTTHYIFHREDSFSLMAPVESSTSTIFTDSDILLDATWCLDVELLFNPSDNNYCNVYLSSSDTDFSSGFNGYYLHIGSRDDNVSLFRQSRNESVRLIEGRHKLLDFSQNKLRIKVRRDVEGNWQLFTDTTMRNQFFKEGEAFDNRWLNGSYIGISCAYTKTRAQHFHFSGFSVSGFPYIDSIPPRIDSLYFSSQGIIKILFNEETDTSHNNMPYLQINGEDIAASACRWTNQGELHIESPKALLRGDNSLSIDSVKDLAGNMLSATVSFFYYASLPMDIVINEIMANPSPYVDLPEYEYVELYNRTPWPLQMEGWKLTTGSREHVLPPCIFLPRSYLLLTYQPVDSLYENIQTLPLFTSEFTLSNVDADVVLECPREQMVHAVSYTRSRHYPPIKEQGGWSLELLDFDNPCHSDSWVSSVSNRGGTPGKENSVYQLTWDEQPPAIKKVVPGDRNMLLVFFSETLLWYKLTSHENWEISGGRTNPEIDSIAVLFPHADKIEIFLKDSLKIDEIYTLKPSLQTEVTDCAGNFPVPGTFRFAISRQADPGDVVINEILFHPYQGGESYIELYNKSEKVIDLSDLYIAGKNDHYEITHAHPASDDGRLLFPKSYLVISKDKKAVTRFYPHHAAENFEVVDNLISLPNEQGFVVLTDRSFSVIDEVMYESSWHAEMIREMQGVALEKIHFALPSEKASSWHSAAEVVGFGTPGLENSQFFDALPVENTFSVHPEIFSPDNDGIDDYLNIQYQLDKPGYIANAMVYDRSGLLVKMLCNNTMLGKDGFLIWNGTSDAGEMVQSGIYIIYVQIFHPEGDQRQYKLPCVAKIKTSS